MLNNPTFYPTPPELIERMLEKIQGEPSYVLEPSAGKGDIIDALTKERYSERRKGEDRETIRGYHWSYAPQAKICAIEKDEELQATLRGKLIKVIDSDFLSFSGPDKFDLIIANPPFDEGDKHLLKAIDILYSGQIIFLLNAETIRNPQAQKRAGGETKGDERRD